MRKILISSIALVGAVALTGLAVLPASAAPAADTTTTTQVTSGVLSITAPGTLVLTNAAPGGTATGTLADVQVTDLTADAVGWVTSVSTADLTSGTETIPGSGFTYTADAAVVAGTATVTSAVASAGTGAVQTATAVTGNNTAIWGATIDLAIPSDALATGADYSTTLTHSVL